MITKIHLTGTIDNGKIHINEIEEWAKYKQQFTEPFHFALFMQPIEEYRSERSTNLFNALIDVFCKTQGLDKSYYRDLFKVRHGVTHSITERGVDSLPNRQGKFLELAETFELHWIVSTNAYTQTEMNQLIDGTINDCVEAGLSEEIQHLIKEWQTT